MKAMLFEGVGRPLEMREIDTPTPGPGEVRVKVSACAVCRTDLHVIDGELDHPKLPLVLGHEIVGRIDALGEGVSGFRAGDRVGVPWLGWTCGECRFCRCGRENLCEKARFTGYDVDGGYAQFALADARYVFPLPEFYSDAEAAPLLCAGLIGYRTLRLAFEAEPDLVGEGRRLGIYGFGAAAHIVAQAARHLGFEIYAFSRPGDDAAQAFARACGAVWAGQYAACAKTLDAALIFAPVGALVPTALKAVARGGCVCCGGIHMSDIPAFPYADLWEERVIRSVANLTRRDADRVSGAGPEGSDARRDGAVPARGGQRGARRFLRQGWFPARAFSLRSFDLRRARLFNAPSLNQPPAKHQRAAPSRRKP